MTALDQMHDGAKLPLREPGHPHGAFGKPGAVQGRPVAFRPRSCESSPVWSMRETSASRTGLDTEAWKASASVRLEFGLLGLPIQNDVP